MLAQSARTRQCYCLRDKDGSYYHFTTVSVLITLHYLYDNYIIKQCPVKKLQRVSSSGTRRWQSQPHLARHGKIPRISNDDVAPYQLILSSGRIMRMKQRQDGEVSSKPLSPLRQAVVDVNPKTGANSSLTRPMTRTMATMTRRGAKTTTTSSIGNRTVAIRINHRWDNT